MLYGKVMNTLLRRLNRKQYVVDDSTLAAAMLLVQFEVKFIVLATHRVVSTDISVDTILEPRTGRLVSTYEWGLNDPPAKRRRYHED